MPTVTITEIRNAKMLRYSVQHNGTEYARVISRPLAEKVAAEVAEHLARVEVSIQSLRVSS